MSLTREPGPRRALGMADGYRWALLSALLALVLMVVVLVMVIMMVRRAPASVGATEPVHAAAGARGVPAMGRHHLAAASHGSRLPSARALLRHAPAAPQTLVRITERRPIRRPKPALRLASSEDEAAPFLVPVPRPAPKAQKVMGARWDLRPPAPETPASNPPFPLVSPASPVYAAVGETGELEAAPEAIFQPQARYPAAAMAEGVTGSVRLKVIINRRGRVEDAIVVRSSGDDRLDEAASTAVLRWRYRPARRQGRPIAGVDYVVVDFYRDDNVRPGSPWPGQ